MLEVLLVIIEAIGMVRSVSFLNQIIFAIEITRGCYPWISNMFTGMQKDWGLRFIMKMLGWGEMNHSASRILEVVVGLHEATHGKTVPAFLKEHFFQSES